jgi:hypothetical protein
MAHVSQSKKAEALKLLKGVIPAGWKWSLSVHNHSRLVLTIYSAPVDLIARVCRTAVENNRSTEYINGTHYEVNQYHLGNQFSGQLLSIFQKIVDALNHGNYDRSDISTDYFDVGHYISIHIGRWDRPFVVTSQVKEAA